MTELEKIFDYRKDLRILLFRRGWLWMQERLNDEFVTSYPFYNEWREVKIGSNYIYLHSEAKITTLSENDCTYILLGHAYNPFTMQYDELAILEDIAAASLGDNEKLIDKINELTGVFLFAILKGDDIMMVSDPAAMLPVFYGRINNKIVISSHAQLIADIFNLKRSAIAEELNGYKWYPRLPGAFLPADLSPFSELKRVVADHVYFIDNDNMRHKRFYPLEKDIKSIPYDDIINEASKIMAANLALIAKKWRDPYISLTGGIDSNTTFAAANNLYDKIHAFSYISASKEEPDASAAREIASTFNCQFKLFNVPDNSEAISDYEIKSEIINHNNAYSNPINDAELRKRISLGEQTGISIEIKSWVSETFRAPMFHRYRRNKMPNLSAKLFRNLYKIFLTNRVLAHRVDAIFKDFIRDFEFGSIPGKFDPSDMFFHECEWGGWGGVCISDMKYCFDITIPYNNRKLIDLLLQLPLEVRMSDRHHLDMKRILNKKLYDMNIHVENVKETKTRNKLLNLIFSANMLSPF